ncbi:MAG: urea transporter [Methylocystis sp.]|uniref:urea transporter n=1 Tax=Methylocystis sp. TaxID=1911079 RepID=UPI003D1149C5
MKDPVDYVFPPVKTGQIPYWRLALRGCSQLCFQANELTGVFFLAAALVASPIAFAYLLLAAMVAPAGRMLLGSRGSILETGLPGLNPCLIALALPAFFHTSWTNLGMWGVLAVSVAATVGLVRLCVAILPFPTLALPFLIVFWALYALAPYLEPLQPIDFGPVEPTTFHPVTAVLLSLGQTVFSPNIWSGLFVLCGVLLSNWRHGTVAFFGAVIGALVSYYYHDVDAASVNLGLYGFNGVLTAVSVFFLCGGKLRLAILGALLATLLVSALDIFGVPTVSAPYVLTTWLMLALGWIEDRWFDVPQSVPATGASASILDAERSSTPILSGDGSMPAPTDSIVITNLLAQADTLRRTSDWEFFRPGVTAHWLYSEGDGGHSAVLLRYEAGARVALHEHVGYEYMFVLEGDQFDEAGAYPQGSFVIHPPGTRHSPGSHGGCLALLIYDRAVKFVAPE